MRVGIDYWYARSHAPGVGRYARELTRALLQLDDCPDVRLLEFGREPVVMDDASLGLDAPHRAVRRRIALPRGAMRALKGVGLGADRLLGGVDVFQQVRLPAAPVSRATQVLTVSELPVARSLPLRNMQRQIAGIRHFLVFSRHHGARLVDEFGIAAERVHQVPVGADHWSRDLRGEVARVTPPRVLVLGAPRRERHHAVILQACERLAAHGYELSLHIAGRRSPREEEFARAMHRSSIRARITWQEPSEADLPLLVAGSSLLVHLTDDEGTAVTPLEAFAMGTAVLASRIPAFEEALADAATLVDTAAVADEPRALADAIAAALQDDQGLACSQRRRAVAAAFTWQRNARATLAAWQGMA